MNVSTPYVAAFGVGTTLSLLLVHMAVRRGVSPSHSVRADLAGASGAWRVAQVGEVFAVIGLGAALVRNCVTGDLRHDLVWVAAFGALGMALWEGVAQIGKRLLFGAGLRAELDQNNLAAGVASAANAVSMSLLLGPALAGNSLRAVGLAMTFFTLALVTHTAFVALFRALPAYDDAEQIRGENLAAALSYAGVSLSVALMVARGVEGDFEGWARSLRGFGAVVACTLGLYPVRQLVVQGLLLGARPTLRGGALDKAIGADRDAPMAALEAMTYLAAAMAITSLA